MAFTRRIFTKEFRLNAAKLVSLDGEDSVSAEQAEIARLRSELQKSHAEVLLLKKFAAYLSKNGLQ